MFTYLISVNSHSELPLTEPIYIVCVLLLIIGIAPLIADAFGQRVAGK